MRLVGFLDEATRGVASGWAADLDRPGEAVTLVLSAGGAALGELVANTHRADLAQAGFGEGRHGFRFDLESVLLPPGAVSLAVQEPGSGQHLVQSPATLPALDALDTRAEAAIAALMALPGDHAALLARADFLQAQAHRVLARLSDRRSGQAARLAVRARKWDEAAPPELPRRALVIDATAPVAGRDAGSMAILSHMESLQRLGFEVSFIAADLRQSGTALASRGVVGVGAPWAASVEEVLRLQAGLFDLVYLHRVEVAARYLPLVQAHMPRARVVYSLADLHSLRLQRQAEVEDRPELVALANHLYVQELAAAAASHAVVTHSGHEAALLRRALPQVAVHVVPWAVPPCPTPAGFAERAGVGFIGGFGHAPNVDAALWLMDEIMPIVWEAAPGTPCVVAGSFMPPALSRPRDPRIRLLGQVAALEEVFGAVRATVAPLAYGAGLKGKVADSLAAGVPCVCSPVAAEGFELPPPLAGLVAADGAGLAASLVRLLSDPVLWQEAREAGLELVRRCLSEEVVDEGLRRAAGLPLQTAQAGAAGRVG